MPYTTALGLISNTHHRSDQIFLFSFLLCVCGSDRLSSFVLLRTQLNFAIIVMQLILLLSFSRESGARDCTTTIQADRVA